MWYFVSLLIIIFFTYSYVFYSSGGQESRAPAKNVSSGIVNYGKESLESLRGNGLVTLDGTKVRGLVEVNGSLNAEEAQIGSLDINGHVSLTHCQVKGPSHISGFLGAEQTTFLGEISIASQKISLQNSTAPSILVRKANWLFGTQTVELGQKSKVTGGITFESGKGKVILSEGSEVSGPIVGGEIERK